MDIITWLVVGSVVGVSISVIAPGSRFGMVEHILFGIVGAFIGGGGFRVFHWHAPFSGIAGVVAISFLGAVIVLSALQLLEFTSRQPR